MIKSRILRYSLRGLIALLIVAIGVYEWSNWPIESDSTVADPAVTLANEIGAKQPQYVEGYVGETGSRIHYVSAGKGEPIIFIHGFPSYWFTMFGLLEAFKSDFNVIAVDGLGVGHSDAPGEVEAYKLEKMVAHLDGVVYELDLKKVHIVGHDWGAAIAVAYAQTRPAKVKTVTAMSALPLNIILSRLQNDVEHQEKFSYVAQFSRANPVLIKLLGIKNNIWENTYAPFVEQGLLSHAQGDRLRADLGQPRRLNRFIHWYRANFPAVGEIGEDDFWPARSQRLTQPSLFIYGDKDFVVSPELVSDLKASADNMQVLKFEGVEHRPHFEQQDRVVDAIRQLISTNR